MRGRRPREPVIWDRSVGTFSGVVLSTPTVGVATIFAPTATVTGALEEELTIRRVLLHVNLSIVQVHGNEAAGDSFLYGIGCLVVRGGETAHDPLLKASADQRAQWLWRWETTLPASGATNVATLAPERNVQNEPGLIDIKVARKLDQDETLVIVVSTTNVDLINGHAYTSQTGFARMAGDVIYQRTMRH